MTVSRSIARGWLALAGLLAGLAAFGAGEVAYQRIPTERVKTKIMGQTLMVPNSTTAMVAEVRNARRHSVYSACFSGGFLESPGALRGSMVAVSGAGVLGAILGLATGVGASFGLLPYFFSTQPYHPEYDLILSVMMHAVIWGLMGAVAGLAFAIGLGERKLILRVIMAAFVGATLGSVVFEFVGAAIFPLASTGQPISTTWATRLLARLLVTLTCVTVVVLSLSRAVPAKGTHSSEVPPDVPS